MVRRARRWDTKFGSWVGEFGVRDLADALSRSGRPVTVSGVHEWIAGRSEPRLQTAMEIRKISRGAVQLEDIVAHRSLVSSPHATTHRTWSPCR